MTLFLLAPRVFTKLLVSGYPTLQASLNLQFVSQVIYLGTTGQNSSLLHLTQGGSVLV